MSPQLLAPTSGPITDAARVRGMALYSRPTWQQPVFGAISGVVATTIVVLSGLSAFAALALFPLICVYWYLGRHSRSELGFVPGRLRHYGVGLLHPALVLGAIALAAWVGGAINTSGTDWSAAGIGFLTTMLVTILMGLLTEEGFFRGWLWSSLRRAGVGPGGLVMWSSLAWSLWHVPVLLWGTDIEASAAQVPIYLASAFTIGIIWGMFRLISGSIVVTSVVHGLWNGAVYVFFGMGATEGALGIQETVLYGPEVGVLGLAINIVIAIELGRWHLRTNRKRPARVQPDPSVELPLDTVPKARGGASNGPEAENHN